MSLSLPQSNFFTTASGTKIHYLQTGNPKGQLLVCMHGLGGSTETYTPLLPYIPQHYNIVLVDFQGFGKSPLKSTTEPLSILGHVADIHDLIASLQGDSDGSAPASKVRRCNAPDGNVLLLIYIKSRSLSSGTPSVVSLASNTPPPTPKPLQGSHFSVQAVPAPTFPSFGRGCST
jgi:hypothetical protein